MHKSYDSDPRQKKVSEIGTVWEWDTTELSEIQTSSDFRHSLYSETQKSGRSRKCQNLDSGKSRFQTAFGIYKPNAANPEVFLCCSRPV